MKHACVIYNPVAGADKGDRIRKAIEEGLSKAKWSYNLHETEEDEDVEVIARDAAEADYDIVIASGGDGTASAVAGGLVGTDIPLGIVPSGTGNSLARELKIPLNAKQAIKLIIGPHALKTVDGLTIGDRHYFLNASVGMSAEAMADTERSQKRQLGLLSYLLTIVEKLVDMEPAHFDLTVDGEHYEFDAADVLVANTSIVGIPQLKLDSNIVMDDGVVGVIVIRAQTMAEYAMAVSGALVNQRVDNDGIMLLPARERVTIEPDRDMPKQADGEPLGHGALTVEVVPGAVSIIVPKAKAE